MPNLSEVASPNAVIDPNSVPWDEQNRRKRDRFAMLGEDSTAVTTHGFCRDTQLNAEMRRKEDRKVCLQHTSNWTTLNNLHLNLACLITYKPVIRLLIVLLVHWVLIPLSYRERRAFHFSQEKNWCNHRGKAFIDISSILRMRSSAEFCGGMWQSVIYLCGLQSVGKSRGWSFWGRSDTGRQDPRALWSVCRWELSPRDRWRTRRACSAHHLKRASGSSQLQHFLVCMPESHRAHKDAEGKCPDHHLTARSKPLVEPRDTKLCRCDFQSLNHIACFNVACWNFHVDYTSIACLKFARSNLEF